MKNLILTLGLVSIMISLAGCQANSTTDFSPTSTDLSSILTDGLNGDFVMDLLIQGRDLWTDTPVGAYRWNLDTGAYQIYTAKDGLADNYVTFIAQDKQGMLWFGTDKGVSRFDGTNYQDFGQPGTGHIWQNWEYFEQPGNTWRSADIKAIVQDSTGNLGFATLDGGLIRYDGNTWKTFTVNPN